MNIKLLLHTVFHLQPQQVFYQLWYRAHKPNYREMEFTDFRLPFEGGLMTEPIPRYPSLDGDTFTFLNLEHPFAGWNFKGNGMLWAYNQNYFDWLNQDEKVNGERLKVKEEEGVYWIDKFIEEEIPGHARNENHAQNNAQARMKGSVGLDPYPIALRSINWIKFFCRYPKTATKPRLGSLYSQVKLLEKKLEYHLLANHLLEDAYALFIAAVLFRDEKLYRKASKLLIGQLKEQVLPDGAHYEQSVMYHCILLDRLLDCINIGQRFTVNGQKDLLSSDLILLISFAKRMLGHLESIIWADGSIPLINDAAFGIAPEPNAIFDYARRLGIEWQTVPLKECGYRKLQSETIEAVVDVGNITASYQPGHTHADTLNYELRINGKPFVVDMGISTYNKTERRQYERSTAAHNCVVVDGKNSYEVWGGFRVGRRCHTVIVDDTEKIASHAHNEVSAWHDGYGKSCKRTFAIENDAFIVEDYFDGDAISYIHLAEGQDENRIKVEGATKIEVVDGEYSTEYNRFHQGKIMKLHFNGKLRYTIR